MYNINSLYRWSDIWCWAEEPGGQCSTNLFIRALTLQTLGPNLPFCSQFGNFYFHLKSCSLHGKLKFVARFMAHIDPTCVLCHIQEETRDPLSRHCPFTNMAWDQFPASICNLFHMILVQGFMHNARLGIIKTMAFWRKWKLYTCSKVPLFIQKLIKHKTEPSLIEWMGHCQLYPSIK